MAIIAVATPAMAFYTECIITRDMALASRPNGPSEPVTWVSTEVTKLDIDRVIRVGGS
jgi:hypothetical protein